MDSISEDVHLFVRLVKDGTLHPSGLKTAAVVGRNSELALEILEKDGFRI